MLLPDLPRQLFFGAPPLGQWDPANYPNFPSTLTSGSYPTTVNYVLEGDSLSAGAAGSGPASWAPLVGALLGTQIKVTNQAAGGRTLATMLSRAAANIDTLISRAPGVLNLLTFQGGINDIVAGGAGGTTTAATIEAAYQSYLAARVAAGWDLVVPINVEASSYWNNASYGTVDYATVAAAIRANAASWGASALIDIAADSVLGPLGSSSNIRYYLDNTHKTINGDSRKARQIIYPVLQALLAPADRAAGAAVYGIAPRNGPIGAATSVGIRVTNLPPTSGHSITATVGGVTATVTGWDPTLGLVYATVPAGSASGDVIVTVDGTTARGGTGLWTAVNDPILASVQPNLVFAAPTPITIQGNPSGAAFTSGMSVTIGGIACTSVVVVSSTVITCVTPTLTSTAAGATPPDVIVGTSFPSAASKIGVLPASVTWAYQANPTSYNASTGHFTDLSANSSNTLTPSSANHPALVTSSFGGAYGVQFVSSPTCYLGNGTHPNNTGQASPWTLVMIAAIPAWGASQGGFVGGNQGYGGQLAAFGHMYSSPAPAGYELGIDGNPGQAIVTSSTGSTSYPGSCFAAVINGSSTKIYVDGVDKSATVTATPPGNFGQGLILGYYGGFFSSFTLGATLLMASDATADLPAVQWLSFYFYGTTYP